LINVNVLKLIYIFGSL